MAVFTIPCCHCWVVRLFRRNVCWNHREPGFLHLHTKWLNNTIMP